MKKSIQLAGLMVWRKAKGLTRMTDLITWPNVCAQRLARIKHSVCGPRRSALTTWLMMLAMLWHAAVAPVANAAGGRSRSLESPPQGEAVAAAQSGDTITVYGPRRFNHLTYPATMVSDQFPLPEDAVAPFTLRIENGTPDGSRRVGSVRIRINGVDLFIPPFRSLSVPSFTLPVTLGAVNRLEVNLIGPLSSYLTITIKAARSPAALDAVEPSRATQGQMLTVTLRGLHTQWVAGQTSASLGAEVSVGGSAFGELGPVTVMDAHTALAAVKVSPTAALAPRTARVVTTFPGGAPEKTETLADAFTVVAVTPPGSASSNVTTLAGVAGSPGFADGAAAQARFQDLAGVAVGPDDAIYVADAGNHRIRVVRNQPGASGTPVLTVSTLAGNGTPGSADGSANTARFNNPQGVAVEASGAVLVADTGNHCIRRIAPDGTVTTMAGDGIAGLRDGPSGQARFNAPRGIAVDSLGNIYVADTGNAAVRVITPSGEVKTVAGDGSIGANDSPNARFNGLVGIAVDGTTVYIYLADTGNHRIRRLDVSGMVMTLAGAERGFADGTANQARFADPSGIAIDGAGKIVVADATNSLVRLVDPDLALSGAASAVTTLAGAGDIRGSTDGPGNLARFFTPRGIAVSASSAIIVADTGNHVLRRILLPPAILSFSPARARAGETIAIQGDRFDGRAPDRNLVRFARAAQAGGGQTAARVTAATRTQLTVIVPEDAATGPVTVQTEGGTAISPTNFEVLSSSPVITDFNPKSAPIGTLITITGSNFVPTPGAVPQVTINKQGGGTIAAPVANSSATTIAFTIPTGAASGLLTVTTGGQSVTSTAQLTIVASTSFTLAAAPNTADVIQGQSISYAVTLSSANGFNQLAPLSVTGLPAGVTATFTPPQITAGQTSVLKITAPSNQPTATATLSVSASATVDGIALTRSANLTLNIKPITTSFLGRTVVADPLETPLAGVTIKFLGVDGNGKPTGCSGQTVSDAAGNFSFTNLPTACAGSQLIRYDGLTAASPPGKYAGVDLVYNLVPNQVTVSPVLVHLPRIDDKETVMVQQNASADQTFTFKTIPNLSVTVYAGTTFTLVDGTKPNPFPFTAVQVPVDRLPDAKPPNPQMLMVFIVAFQPANATASQPVAITYPNTINTAPGTNMVLMTLDPTKGTMVPYGTGTVADDGMQVIPDLDPAHPGRRYGLVHFDWHGQMPPPINDVNLCPACPAPEAGDPIDISSGVAVYRHTDIAMNGLRGGVTFVRTYRGLSVSERCVGGGVCGGGAPFGVGISNNYAYQLNINQMNDMVINLVMPNESQFPFTKQADSTYLNSTNPLLRGAVLRKVSANGDTFDLRWKDGTTFRFERRSVLQFFIIVLTSITDPNGNKIILERDGQRLTGIVDPVGRRLTLNYDSNGFVSEIRDPIGRRVVYDYSGGIRSLLTAVHHPDGSVTRYEYNRYLHLTRILDPRGVVLAENTYDRDDPIQRVIEQKRPDGGKLKFEYKLLNPTVPTSPVQETTVTDPLGNKTVYRFNSEGFPIGVTDTLGQTKVLEREGGSNLLTTIKGNALCGICGDPGAGDQTFSYDAFGNLLASTDALGNKTTLTYEPVFNRVASITDPLGKITGFTYDSRGNLMKVTDANGKITSFENQNGLITSITDPLNQRTILSYDSFGNLAGIVDPLGHKTSLRYDAVSRPIEAVDSLGRRSAITYDNLDRVITATNAKNDNASFAYDAVGNLLSVTNAKGSQTKFTYDALNRLETKTTPLGKTDTRQYDLNGNLKQFVDRRGQKSEFTYDALDRLIGETYLDGSRVSRSYDANSRLLRVDDPAGGAFVFSYDLAGRLVGSAGPFGTVQYLYDQLGRVTSRQVVGQPAVEYSYDPVGNLLKASTSQATVNFEYDARNQLLKLNRSNGVSTQYGYDELGRLLSLTHSRGAEILNSQSYVYDAVGNRTRYTTNIGRPLGTQPASSQYDKDNRLLQRDATTYSYDNNGNLIIEAGPAGLTTYTWDSRNRLQSIVTPTGQTTTFLYDFAGNLISQKDTGPGLNLSQNFVLDDLTNIAYQSNGNGDQFSVLTGQSIDEHLAIVRSGGQVEYVLSDAINSTIATVDRNGAIKTQFSYDAFGQTGSMGGSYPFQYTGRVPVSENLYYYRARYYSAIAGRFISEDPIGFSGGLNQYDYVLNDPINLIDPNGEIPLVVIIPVVAGVISGTFSAINEARKCNARGLDILRAFGNGAIGGIVGSSVGLLTRNPYLAGAASGLASNLVEQFLNGGKFNSTSPFLAAGLGGLTGGVSSVVIPRGPGRPLDLFLSRSTLSDFTKLSQVSLGRTVLSGVLSGERRLLLNGAGDPNDCGCR